MKPYMERLTSLLKKELPSVSITLRECPDGDTLVIFNMEGIIKATVFKYIEAEEMSLFDKITTEAKEMYSL